MLRAALLRIFCKLTPNHVPTVFRYESQAGDIQINVPVRPTPLLEIKRDQETITQGTLIADEAPKILDYRFNAGTVPFDLEEVLPVGTQVRYVSLLVNYTVQLWAPVLDLLDTCHEQDVLAVVAELSAQLQLNGEYKSVVVATQQHPLVGVN